MKTGVLLRIVTQLPAARVVIPEAVGAVYGAIVAGLERDLCVLAALGANNIVHRAVLAVTAAGTAGMTAP